MIRPILPPAPLFLFPNIPAGGFPGRGRTLT